MKTLGDLRKWLEDNRALCDDVPVELQIGWESSDMWEIEFIPENEFVNPRTDVVTTFPDKILMEG